jgi:hypothetical protein
MPYDQSIKNRRIGKALPFGNAIERQPCSLDKIEGAVQPDLLNEASGRETRRGANTAGQRTLFEFGTGFLSPETGAPKGA